MNERFQDWIIKGEKGGRKGKKWREFQVAERVQVRGEGAKKMTRNECNVLLIWAWMIEEQEEYSNLEGNQQISDSRGEEVVEREFANEEARYYYFFFLFRSFSALYSRVKAHFIYPFIAFHSYPFRAYEFTGFRGERGESGEGGGK